MTLVAITGIEDPLYPNICKAATTCYHMGVIIKMCIGDNIPTSCLITTQCSIYTAGGIIMGGPVFHALDSHECIEAIPCLQVLV